MEFHPVVKHSLLLNNLNPHPNHNNLNLLLNQLNLQPLIAMKHGNVLNSLKTTCLFNASMELALVKMDSLESLPLQTNVDATKL